MMVNILNFYFLTVSDSPDIPFNMFCSTFYISVYFKESSEHSKYVPSWKKTITQYGGEIESSPTSPMTQVTHVLCSSQKSALAQQGRVEGKRLVTAFWLNDTIKRKKVRLKFFKNS